MDEKNPKQACRCAQASCGCASAVNERCSCGPSCGCQPTCRCGQACGCANRK